MKITKSSFNNYVKNNVFSTLNDYKLISDKELVMVGVSGGKDSILTLHMLTEYQKESSLDFDLEAVCIDEGIKGYREKGIESAKENCEELDVPLTIVSFKDEWGYTLDEINDMYPSTCMPCGIYRRYLLNRVSNELNCDKIATGHNMDDEIQSFIMTLARNTQNKFSKFSPVLDKIHENLVPRIKPLWQLSEKDVATWCVINDISIHQEECPYSRTSFRSKVKLSINKIEEEKKGTKKNIFNSFKNTFKVPKNESPLTNCELCGQATAHSPCKACEITKEIRNRL